MKLAVFFPASLFSAWACSYGLVDCLRRMGHVVTSVPVDPSRNSELAVPLGIDGIVVSGPEHIGRHIISSSAYKPKLPSVSWLHETVEREDYGKLDVDAIKRSADVVFCPAIQDEKYGFRYMPFGVDTEIFNPGRKVMERYTSEEQVAGSPLTPKSIDAAFIGLLYPKRQAFLAELKKHGVNLVTGNVQVLELGGVNPRKTAELYADNIRKIKVFVNLPTLSRLAVTKIYEVLACGTPILTPEVTDMRNLEGLPVTAYRTAKDVAEFLDGKRSSPYLLNSHSFLGDNPHRLELRCETLISALKEIGVQESVLA